MQQITITDTVSGTNLSILLKILFHFYHYQSFQYTKQGIHVSKSLNNLSIHIQLISVLFQFKTNCLLIPPKFVNQCHCYLYFPDVDNYVKRVKCFCQD